ncbi:MAG: hypothetical protein PPP55_10020 [Halorubrum sp.]
MTTALIALETFVGFRWLPADYWDLSIPVYLYLAALAGGAYLTGASACFIRSWRGSGACCLESEIARWGFLISVFSAAGAGLAVMSHLAVVYRALLFPVYLTNFSSWITIGTWILVILSVLATVCLVLQLFGESAAADDGASLWPRVIVAKLGILGTVDRLVDRVRPPMAGFAALHVLGSLFALATIYTGFELSIVETVPLWNEPAIVPALFLTSGVAAGIGLTLAVTMLFEREIGPVFGGYAVAVGVLSGVSLLIAGYGWTLLAGSEAPAASASYGALTSGTLAIGVWVVVIGLVLALLAGIAFGVAAVAGRLPEPVERAGGPILIGSFGLLTVSGLVMRILFLLAAEQHPVVVVA